uniref:Uncharacterized protein n=1 Tax=Anguilla anguilla TaxID=7936 RepID=A0A0E9THS0_ANGAN
MSSSPSCSRSEGSTKPPCPFPRPGARRGSSGDRMGLPWPERGHSRRRGRRGMKVITVATAIVMRKSWFLGPFRQYAL